MLKIQNDIVNEKILNSICQTIQNKLNEAYKSKGKFTLTFMPDKLIHGIEKPCIEILLKEWNALSTQRYWFNCENCKPFGTIPSSFKKYRDISTMLKEALEKEFAEEQ